MSTATIDAIEALEATRRIWNNNGREVYYHHTLGKGATTYEVRFSWPVDPADRTDWWGDGFAAPRVSIIKYTKSNSGVIDQLSAPNYVRDFIHKVRLEIGRREHARHGVTPISFEQMERWNRHGLKTGQEIRRAEHYLKTIERPGVRRTQAQEIAAEMVHSFIERAEHEDAFEDLKRFHEQIVEDLKMEHVEALEEAEQKENKAAREVVDWCGGFFERLDEPDPFAYAYGATTVEKIKDLARDAIDAIERYDAKTL